MQHDRSDAVTQVHEELVNLVRELMTGERIAGGLPTFAQHAMLAYIQRNPGCRATDISEAFGVHRSTVSRQLRQCADGGWVSVSEGPVRQGRPLTLTEDGVTALDGARRERLGQVRVRTQDWSTDDIAEFAALLHHFRVQSIPARTTIDTSGDEPSA